MTGGVSRWWTVAWPIVLVLVPGFAFGACVYNALRPDERDVEDVAQSAVVVAADQQSTGWINDELTSIGSGAPWLEPLRDEIDDECQRLGGALGGAGVLRCTRGVTRFYGFDGDFAGRAKALTNAVVNAGWLPNVARTYREHAGTKVDSRPFGATDLPSVSVAGPRYAATLEASWAERPAPFTADRDIDRGRRPHMLDTVYREARPLDVVAFTNFAFLHHKYVLRLAITDVYVGNLDMSTTEPAQPPATTPAIAPAAPCYSGSNDCVGG